MNFNLEQNKSAKLYTSACLKSLGTYLSIIFLPTIITSLHVRVGPEATGTFQKNDNSVIVIFPVNQVSVGLILLKLCYIFLLALKIMKEFCVHIWVGQY